MSPSCKMERSYSDGEEAYDRSARKHRFLNSLGHGQGDYHQFPTSYNSDTGEVGGSNFSRLRMWSFHGQNRQDNTNESSRARKIAWSSNQEDFDYYSKQYRAPRGLVNNRMRRKETGSRRARIQMKKRIYFCTLCSSLDIPALHDYLNADFFAASTWSFFLVGDCLRLYKQSGGGEMRRNSSGSNLASHTEDEEKRKDTKYTSEMEQTSSADLDKPSDILDTQEIFIFDFGACVFWGFYEGEEFSLLKIIREHCKEGMVGDDDFEDGEDDMHFVVMSRDHRSYDGHLDNDMGGGGDGNGDGDGDGDGGGSRSSQRIHIANDCVMLPERTNAKQRLAISYAIAQSSILKLMETQIENRMDDYEHIPLALAKGEHVKLSSTQLGKMIGEILMLRHEVNLHSDLLGIPDFFWEEDKYAGEYDLSRQYFEMELRIDIFNKRLDLLKQLVSVVNAQLINVHGKYRTEIIIVIIFIYCIFLGIQQFSPWLWGMQLA